MNYFKRFTASLIAVLTIALSLSCAAVSAAEYTDNCDDPGAGRYSGNILPGFFDDDTESELPMFALGAPAGTSSISPFKNAVYFHNSHSNYELMNGIDVSQWNGDINWNSVSAAGVDFAIIRAGYRGYGEAGTLVADSRFKEYMNGANSASIPVGVYIYSQAITEAEAVQEAQFILDRVQGYNIELPLVLDYEYASVGSGTGGRLYNANLTQDEATAICTAFCKKVEAAGYTAMVYANKSMLTNQLHASNISSSYQIWLAHYTTSSNYTGAYNFWQYTSTGSVSGINGNVDCNFMYIEVPATDIDITTPSLTIDWGSTVLLSASLTPYNATSPIRWSSSDKSVASVDSDGTLHTNGVGTAVITAKSANVSDQCYVTVKYPKVSGVKLSADTLLIEKGATAVLTADVLPEHAENKSVSWSSSKTSIAKVSSSGVITAVAVGTAVITATTNDGGYKASCSVKVGAPVSSISLSPSTLSLNKGETASLYATVKPDSAASFWDVSYSSSNPTVATVSSNGTVTAKSAGSAVITVLAGSASTTCTVNVAPTMIDLSINVKLASTAKSAFRGIAFTLTNNSTGVVTTGNGSSGPLGALLTSKAYEGIYRLYITKPGYLSYTDKTYTIGSGTNPQPELIPGDINGDGYVNAKDTALITECITTGSAAYNSDADYTCDGVINANDRKALLSGFGKRAEVVD